MDSVPKDIFEGGWNGICIC